MYPSTYPIEKNNPAPVSTVIPSVKTSSLGVIVSVTSLASPAVRTTSSPPCHAYPAEGVITATFTTLSTSETNVHLSVYDSPCSRDNPICLNWMFQSASPTFATLYVIFPSPASNVASPGAVTAFSQPARLPSSLISNSEFVIRFLPTGTSISGAEVFSRTILSIQILC